MINKVRGDTSTNWTAKNPLLRDSERGRETDTGKTKMGDGVTFWKDLDYELDAGTVLSLVALPNGEVAVGNGAGISSSPNFTWDGANLKLGISYTGTGGLYVYQAGEVPPLFSVDAFQLTLFNFYGAVLPNVAASLNNNYYAALQLYVANSLVAMITNAAIAIGLNAATYVNADAGSGNVVDLGKIHLSMKYNAGYGYIPITNLVNGFLIYCDLVNGAGSAAPFAYLENAAHGQIAIIEIKTTTGDPTGYNGRFVINTADGTVKLYANGAWQSISGGGGGGGGLTAGQTRRLAGLSR